MKTEHNLLRNEKKKGEFFLEARSTCGHSYLFDADTIGFDTISVFEQLRTHSLTI